MTTDEVLLGTSLILVLAVGSQVLAARLRIPALVVLLPAGFAAGALTSSVNPERLLGEAFQPLVLLSVAVILYEAGLNLEVRKLRGHTRRVVRKLITIGVPVTAVSAALFAVLLLPVSWPAAIMIGAILVVSGPTVVTPLLAFIRPVPRLQRVLAWEGSLIDPVGGILGAVVFHAVSASGSRGPGRQVGLFALSIGVGLAGAVVGAALLWFLLHTLALGDVLGTAAQFASVVAVAAVCDVVREDSGLIAAIGMGLAVANLRGFGLPARRPFFETLVQLIIGILFIAISATVTPQSLRHLILPVLGLAAVLMLVTRPLVAFLATARTTMTSGERRFTGWMAPRGIVAAATASAFSEQLAAQHIGGAAKILPVTFLVIVITVTGYGLTAVPVARRLGVTRPARTRPLLVGGQPWVIGLGRALRSAGLDVLMWAGLDSEREQIRRAGLELAPGELLAAAAGSGAELEGITAVLLLTSETDFDALASEVLAASVDGPVYRLGARQPGHGVVSPYLGGQVLFGAGLSGDEIDRRWRGGQRLATRPGRLVPAGHALLARVRADGRLDPVTGDGAPAAGTSDTMILLGPEPGGRGCCTCG